MKNPMADNVGRPRTLCPPDEILIDLGIFMVWWVKINQPLHISEFWSGECFFPENLWDNIITKKEFATYYEAAMRLIGKQYLDKNSNVREGASQRWQRIYFRELAKEEDECVQKKIDYEYDKKSQLDANLQKPPLQNQIDLEHENMILKAELAKYK